MSLSRKFAAFVVDLTDLVIGGEPIVRRRSGPRPPPIFKHPSHCLSGQSQPWRGETLGIAPSTRAHLRELVDPRLNFRR